MIIYVIPIVELLAYLDQKHGALTKNEKAKGQAWLDGVVADLSKQTT